MLPGLGRAQAAGGARLRKDSATSPRATATVPDPVPARRRPGHRHLAQLNFLLLRREGNRAGVGRRAGDRARGAPSEKPGNNVTGEEPKSWEDKFRDDLLPRRQAVLMARRAHSMSTFRYSLGLELKNLGVGGRSKR